jgi:pectate lyase-like protein
MVTMKPHHTFAALLATVAATALVGPVRADIFPPVGMNSNASNATLPLARNNLGAAAGNGANVVADYGADPTGAADSTSAIANAVAGVCNSASPVFQTREVFIPAGLYKVSGVIPVSNGCWIHGQNPQGGGFNAGATVLRMTNGCSAGDLFRFRGFGQFRLSDLQVDTAGFAYCGGGASYAKVHAGGANYALNDTITLTGGTFTTATVLKVTALSGTAVTGGVIQTPGTYSVAPSAIAPVAQGSSSGTR